MNGKQLKDKLNGKKRYVFGGVGVVIGMPFLVNFLFNMNATVAIVESRSLVNERNIMKLSELPERVVKIEECVSSLEYTFKDFRSEQRKQNTKMSDKVDEILKAVLR